MGLLVSVFVVAHLLFLSWVGVLIWWDRRDVAQSHASPLVASSRSVRFTPRVHDLTRFAQAVFSEIPSSDRWTYPLPARYVAVIDQRHWVDREPCDLTPRTREIGRAA